MGIDMIRKRDGREVPFDQDKIEQAIFASFQASGSARGHETSRKLTEEVVRLLENNENISAIPSVEQVQDTVEQVLMRNGFEGYKEIQQNSMDVTTYCHEQIGRMKCFKNYAPKVVNPLFIWMMDPEYDKTAKWTLFDLQAKLQQSGWMVPAYTMPKNIEQVVVMRIVARQGMSRDMADMLLGDIRNAVAEFEQLAYSTTSRLKYERREKQMGKVYTH